MVELWRPNIVPGHSLHHFACEAAEALGSISADGDSSSTIRSTRLETTWCGLCHIGLPARLLITDTLRIRDWHGESATYRADLVALIDAPGLHDRVDLRPAAYADMPSLYAEADVVVYPTVGEEPYGLVPLEAMSCGSPVVVARSGGLSETVLDGNTGLVVPPNRRECPHGCCGTAPDVSPDDARAMGVAGRRLVKRRFTLDSYGTLLLQRYMGKTVPGI